MPLAGDDVAFPDESIEQRDTLTACARIVSHSHC